MKPSQLKFTAPGARPIFSRTKLLAGAVLASLVLTSCLRQDPASTGFPNETDQVRLTGRVVGSGSNPVSGVVVRLARGGIVDTTDALGRYHISNATAIAGGTGVVLDTLYYAKNGQSLGRVSVVSWIDSLPDVQVIQRDIAGLLQLSGVTVTKVEAVVTGDGIDSTNPVTSEFYYNALTGNYSGFVYFPPSSSVLNYAVHVNVYGTGGVFAGRSTTVPFNSFAGNITIPVFSADNAQPIAKAGVDTGVAVGSTILLHGSALDSLGGSIAQWEWSIGGGTFVTTSSGDTSFSRNVEGAFTCILRVTDNDGNKAVDTLIASVLSNGTAWTSRTSGTSAALSSVTWAGTQFVAVGSGATVVTSPDGITWTARVIDTTRRPTLTDVAWSGKKIVAVPVNASMQENFYTSVDGITWVPGHLPSSVVTSGPLLISAADTTLIVANQSNTSRFFLRSENDGTTWFSDTLPPEGNGFLSSTWAFTKHAGRYIGVGGNGTTASSVAGGTWTRHTITTSFPAPYGGVYDYTMMSVVSTGSHAVAVGFAGHVMRSTDGMTWQQPRIAANIPEQAPGSSIGNLNEVVWTGSTLVAVGNGFTVASADGGVNWAQVQTGATTLRSVAWNGTRLVAVGSSGQILTSP